MGLFDGARDGSGSSADLAAEFNLPIILVVQAAGQSNSVSAVLHGFNSYRADTRIAGVIFNGVGSKAHGDILRKAAADVDIPCLGLVPKSADLQLPRRHLGLVQADEKSDLDAFLNKAADIVSEAVDLQALENIAASMTASLPPSTQPPLMSAQHIALAYDTAFRFVYPHLEAQWQAAGVKVSRFSPLANEAPEAEADFIYLPGGYPELHLPALAKADRFLQALQEAKRRGVALYGECGGYMVMGDDIIGKDGKSFAMAGVLPIKTSFANPKLHLGYRQVALQQGGPLGSTGACFRAHEFHYAQETARADDLAPLFHARDAVNADLGAVGAVSGSAFGSFIHLIDKAE
jgi:cobyrinic acid a,c-diamide synthase